MLHVTAQSRQSKHPGRCIAILPYLGLGRRRVFWFVVAADIIAKVVVCAVTVDLHRSPGDMQCCRWPLNVTKCLRFLISDAM
jgi:hypothetical protein